MNTNKKKVILGLAAAVVAGGGFWPAAAVAGEVSPGTCGGSASWCEDVTACDIWVNGECTHKVKTSYYIDLKEA
jgi:hypothetical protein